MAKALTREQAEAKVYELTKQLAEIKAEKKASNGEFKDRLNDVEDEIKEILEEQEGQNTPGTSP